VTVTSQPWTQPSEAAGLSAPKAGNRKIPISATWQATQSEPDRTSARTQPVKRMASIAVVPPGRMSLELPSAHRVVAGCERAMLRELNKRRSSIGMTKILSPGSGSNQNVHQRWRCNSGLPDVNTTLHLGSAARTRRSRQLPGPARNGASPPEIDPVERPRRTFAQAT